MKNKISFLAIVFAFIGQSAFSQKHICATTGGKLIFSSANVSVAGADANVPI